MTHLETYLDCLKLLPNELQREFVLMGELDRRAANVQLRLDALQEHVLEAATKGVTAMEGKKQNSSAGANGQPVSDPSEQQLYEIRQLQGDLVDLHNEKLALARQSRDMVLGYASRLDYDMSVYAADLGPELRAAAADPFEESGSNRKKSSSARNTSAKEQRGGGGGHKARKRAAGGSSDESSSSSGGSSDEDDEDEGADEDEEQGDEEGDEEEYAPTARGGGAGGGGQKKSSNAAVAAASASAGGMEEASPTDGEDKKLYCICQQPSYGDMVGCDNESCPYEWFHFSCVGLKKHPKGDWVCDECKSKMEA